MWAFAWIDYTDNFRNPVESEMFAARNLRRAIDLQRLCCSMGYVSVM